MLKIFEIEFMKLKRSGIIIITALIPLLCTLGGVTYVKQPVSTMQGLDPWLRLYLGSMIIYSSLLFPCLIAFIMAMTARIEHGSNGWKQLLAMPVKRESIYIVKLMTACLLVLLNIIILILALMILGKLLGISTPLPYDIIIGKPLLIFASSLPIIAIMYYISIRFSHIGIPAGIGAGLALPAIMIANSEKYWIFYPWTYPIFTGMSSEIGFTAGNKTAAMWIICILTFAILLAAGLFRFKRTDI